MVTYDATVEWFAQNPVAACGVVFLVCLVDALLVIGLTVPSMPVLFAAGALIGLGLIDPWLLILAAAAGAILGDVVSYWLGRHYGTHLKQMWPLTRYPQFLAQSEVFFQRHGIKGIVIGRYFGAVRCFVPAIAGMMGMRWRHFLPTNIAASLTWAPVFMAPGILLGASLDLLAAVAGRLAVVLGILIVLVWLTSWLILFVYRLLAPRASRLLERALSWCHRHPILGRIVEPVVDPARPESLTLALLGLLLIGAGWVFFALILAVPRDGSHLGIDDAMYQAMLGLRTPLADHLMAWIGMFGAWQVQLPAVLAVLAWLLLRARYIAALHWLAAIGFGLALVLALGWTLEVPAPPPAVSVPGFGFPATQVAMSTVIYGFFAVLVARELPGRRRTWPYLMAGGLVASVGFARLYFGAHWLSDVLAGVLLGMVWIALLGIAYRRRTTRSFWVRPVSWLFFVTLGLAAVWHGNRATEATLARYQPPEARVEQTLDAWWASGFRSLPATRNARQGSTAQPLNLQYAGSLDTLRETLMASGWREESAGGWLDLLLALNPASDPDSTPFLPSVHQGRPESLLMARAADDRGARLVLRLWPSVIVLAPDAVPVWQGVVATNELEAWLGLFRLWRYGPPYDGALDALDADLGALTRRRVLLEDGGVLLLHERGRGNSR
jgi:membrane protein DedA with SNARE-associated domain/membrane-associated phospholipid phosphatase